LIKLNCRADKNGFKLQQYCCRVDADKEERFVEVTNHSNAHKTPNCAMMKASNLLLNKTAPISLTFPTPRAKNNERSLIRLERSNNSQN